MRQWLNKEYPKIKALARREKAGIYSGEALVRQWPIRSGHHAGRTWGKCGETPIVQATGARHSCGGSAMSLIPASNSRGHMRFMIKEKGGVNAAVFIEFLKPLIAGAKRTIFLIADRGPAHRAKKTKAFVETLDGKLRLFFLPPYSPDRNPPLATPLEHVPKKLLDFFDQDMLQLFDFERVLIDQMIPFDRDAL